jgi:COP9 signalosome complex subunit 1
MKMNIEQPKLDLETYIKSYSGRTRLIRLLFIAIYSSHLRSEAISLARDEARRGDDVRLYKAVTDFQRQVDPTSAETEEASLAWVKQKDTRNNATTNQLERELKSYKNNLIKESIRMGTEDLAQHYFRIGDLDLAKKAMTRLRDLCVTPKHVFDLSIKRIVIGVEQEDWLTVSTNSTKARAGPGGPEDEPAGASMLTAAGALAHLAGGRYSEAAAEFLKVDPAIGESFNSVISQNDIAIYASLCALATMTRSQLKARVLERKEFREFLELEPQMRRAISAYYNLKFKTVLEILNDYQTDLELDIHLGRHIHEIYSRIRAKALIQFFEPYSRVPLSVIAETFSSSKEDIEKECIVLIKNKSLNARLDAVHGDLVLHRPDERKVVYDKALTNAESYLFQLKARLWQMKAVEAGFVLKSSGGSEGKDYDVGGTAGFGGLVRRMTEEDA